MPNPFLGPLKGDPQITSTSAPITLSELAKTSGMELASLVHFLNTQLEKANTSVSELCGQLQRANHENADLKRLLREIVLDRPRKKKRREKSRIFLERRRLDSKPLGPHWDRDDHQVIDAFRWYHRDPDRPLVAYIPEEDA